MKRFTMLLLCAGLLVLASPLFSGAQSSPNTTVSPMAKVLNGHLSYLESELIPAVEAMPDEQFDYVPKNGEFATVRTFAQQVMHVAADNFVVSAAILREKPPVAVGPTDFANPPKTKSEIVKLLKDSLAYAHKAINSVNEQNAFAKVQSPYDPNGSTNNVSLMTGMLTHNWDHYGQLVVYLRLNGIIPPASRPKDKK